MFLQIECLHQYYTHRPVHFPLLLLLDRLDSNIQSVTVNVTMYIEEHHVF